MDNRRERKTSGESTASDDSEIASYRPYYLPETPAAASSSQVVRSACSSSASLSRVGDYSRSPAGGMLVKHGTPTYDELEGLGYVIAEKWKKLGRRLCVSVPRLQEIDQAHAELSEKGYYMLVHWKEETGSAATYKVLSDALRHQFVERQDLAEEYCYINDKSREEKRRLSPSWSTPDPKQAKLTHGCKTVAFKEGTPDALELDELAGKICAKWQELGLRLGISQDVLDEIDANARKKPYQMLLYWRDTTASATLYRDLYYALGHHRVGLSNVANEFCEKRFRRERNLRLKLSDEGLDSKSRSKIKAELSDEGLDTESERKVKAKLSDEGLDSKSERKIKAEPSDEGPDTKSEKKIEAKLSDKGPDTKTERKIEAELSDKGLDTKSEKKIKTKLSDEGLDAKTERKIEVELSAEGLDTKSERKIEAKLSVEGLDTKLEGQVKIDPLQKMLGTKSEKCEINRLGVVWKPQGIQAAACITFPQNAVTQPVLFICTLLEDPMHHPPLKKDEALVSDVIELSYDDPHGSNFTGDFSEMVSVALPHSAINLRGYEIVIRELVDSHSNDWRDLETTNTWQASGEVPFAEAKVMCCSSFAVVCRLKSYTYTPHALEDRDFTCTVEEYPDVSVTVPASVIHENKELQLTLKVQEIPRQWYEDSGVIVGPVLHITCSPEIQLFDPATITLPFSLQNDNECAKLSSGNVRVLVNSHEEDENETNPRADWEEVTTQLPIPAALRNGVVTFQVTHFSWYTILWERSAERNRKRKSGAFRMTGRKSGAFRMTGRKSGAFRMTGRKSGAFRMTGRKSPYFRITGRIPQAGCFFACLCTTDTEYLPLGSYCLHCFCCPLHVESRVKEIIRSTEGAILYGGGESSEPLCPDDVIHISLLKGLKADAHTTFDETQLRFRGGRHYSRYLMVKWTGKRKYTPKVGFHRCLDDQSQRSLYTCSIAISVGRMESQPVAVRDHTLTRKEAFNLSQELGSRWKSLGRELEIDEDLLTKFHRENEELEEKAYQMLLHWKQNLASTATYAVLFKALCEVSRRDLAEKYCAANTNSL